jgi:hypothetical protein
LNEDSHLNNSGRMVPPTKGTHHELVGAADVSAAQALDGDNDVDIKFTDKASLKLVSQRKAMIADRKRRKVSHKIQRTLRNTSFELAVTEAEVFGLNSDESFFEAPYPVVYGFRGDSPALPQLEDWNHDDHIQSVHQLPAVVSVVNSVVETSVFADGPGVPKTSIEFGDDCELSRMDAMSAAAASVSCAYDPVLFCDILDYNIARSKLSSAEGSTTATFQDPDSVIDFWDDPEPDPGVECMGEGSALMDVFASETHAEGQREWILNFSKRFRGLMKRRQRGRSRRRCN